MEMVKVSQACASSRMVQAGSVLWKWFLTALGTALAIPSSELCFLSHDTWSMFAAEQFLILLPSCRISEVQRLLFVLDSLLLLIQSDSTNIIPIKSYGLPVKLYRDSFHWTKSTPNKPVSSRFRLLESCCGSTCLIPREALSFAIRKLWRLLKQFFFLFKESF